MFFEPYTHSVSLILERSSGFNSLQRPECLLVLPYKIRSKYSSLCTNRIRGNCNSHESAELMFSNLVGIKSCSQNCNFSSTVFERGIEWSLRALASMRAVRLFLRARAVIKYILRAASTLKNSYGKQRELRKLSGQNLDLSLLKETF